MIYIGIDEAGRGPVLGPLVIGCVACSHSALGGFEGAGVTDSKVLSAKKRESLVGTIHALSVGYAIESVSAEKITTHMRAGTNLNAIEALYTSVVLRTVIASLDTSIEKRVMIDLPSKK
jgi:ribonuclease HII